MEYIYASRLPDIATASNKTIKSLKVIIEEKGYNLRHLMPDGFHNFRVFSWSTSETEGYVYPEYDHMGYSRLDYHRLGHEHVDSAMVQKVIEMLGDMGFSYKNVIDPYYHKPDDFYIDLSLSALFALAAAQLVENNHNIKCKYVVELPGGSHFSKDDTWTVEMVDTSHENDDNDSSIFELAFTFDTDLPHKEIAEIYESEYQKILDNIADKNIISNRTMYGAIDSKRFIRSYKEYKTKPRAKKKPESFKVKVSKDFAADEYILDFLKEKGLMDALYEYKVKYFTEINKPNVLLVNAEIMLGDADGSENDTQVIPLKYFDLIADWVKAYSANMPKETNKGQYKVLEVGNEYLRGDWSWVGVEALFGIGKEPGSCNFDNENSYVTTDYAVWDKIEAWGLADETSYEDVLNDENDVSPDSWDYERDLIFKLFCYACYWDKHGREKEYLINVKEG